MPDSFACVRSTRGNQSNEPHSDFQRARWGGSSSASDTDSEAPLDLDLDELQRQASIALNSPCTDIKKLCRGSFHEIFVLQFQQPLRPIHSNTLTMPARSCIARCARTAERIETSRSTIATMRYLKEHDILPVPEVYYSSLDSANGVGTSYILMERLPGEPLQRIWDDIDLEKKKHVIRQIAGVIARLATAAFDTIGSLQDNGIGPLYPIRFDGQLGGPFKTAEDYLLSFIKDEGTHDQKLKSAYGEVRSIIHTAASSSLLRAPFPLIHADSNLANLMFLRGDENTMPNLTSVIDWDHAYTGPLYYLFDCPIFIQDVDFEEEAYADNKILRKEFARWLQRCFEGGSDMRELAWQCLQEKTFILNEFRNPFIFAEREKSQRDGLVKTYLSEVRDGTGMPYTGRPDYEWEDVERLEDL